MHTNHLHTFSILYEDDSILVANKPAGLMVEPDRNGHPNLLQQVKRYLKNDSSKGNEEVYAQHIHRLDRPVSGVVLFAKQRTVLKKLSEQFAERKVKKFYQALTAQAPALKTGTLEHWHRKEKRKPCCLKRRKLIPKKHNLTMKSQAMKTYSYGIFSFIQESIIRSGL